jgi:hypothetical protein
MQPPGTDLGKQARMEVTLKMDVIVLVNSKYQITKQDGISPLQHTIESLENNHVKPNSIIVGFNIDITPHQVIHLLNDVCNINWKGEIVFEEDPTVLRCIDVCAKKSDTTFYAMFHAGFTIPQDFIQRIDQLINDELARIIVLKPIDKAYNGVVLHKMACKQVGSNRNRPVIEKLEEIAWSQECPTLIRSVREVVPSMAAMSSCQ